MAVLSAIFGVSLISITLWDAFETVVLAFFRSQHDNQSWLGSMNAILDTCALIMAGLQGACQRQAELAFAMARHSIVDLSQIFLAKPRRSRQDRFAPDKLAFLCSAIESSGIKLQNRSGMEQKLADLCRMYEPYINALSTCLRISIPPWIFPDSHIDNWQTSAWEQRSAGSRKLVPPKGKMDEHFLFRQNRLRRGRELSFSSAGQETPDCR